MEKSLSTTMDPIPQFDFEKLMRSSIGLNDVTFQIFSYLDMDSLAECRLVNHLWHDYLSSEKKLWLRFFGKKKESILDIESMKIGLRTEGSEIQRFWQLEESIEKEGTIGEIMILNYTFKLWLDMFQESSSYYSRSRSDLPIMVLILQRKGCLGIFQLLRSKGFISEENINKDSMKIVDWVCQPVKSYKHEARIDVSRWGRKLLEYIATTTNILFETKSRFVLCVNKILRSLQEENLLRILQLKPKEFEDWQDRHVTEEYQESLFPFRTALATKNLEIIRIVTDGMDVDQPFKCGSYPLHIAAQNGNFKVYEFIYNQATNKSPERSIKPIEDAKTIAFKGVMHRFFRREELKEEKMKADEEKKRKLEISKNEEQTERAKRKKVMKLEDQRREEKLENERRLREQESNRQKQIAARNQRMKRRSDKIAK